MVVSGWLLEAIIAKFHYFLTKAHYREHHFTFGRYVFWLLFPLAATLLLAYLKWGPVLEIFIVFAFVGTAIEWFVGWSYHQVIGQRLWTYHRYSVGKYTSILSMPLWGLAGVLFWFLAQIFK